MHRLENLQKTPRCRTVFLCARRGFLLFVYFLLFDFVRPVIPICKTAAPVVFLIECDKIRYCKFILICLFIPNIFMPYYKKERAAVLQAARSAA